MRGMRLITVLVSLGLACGCGDGNPVQPTPTSVLAPTPSITSISPASATAGSSDVTLKVIATNFVQRPVSSLVVWSASGIDTVLNTTFVSTTELAAVIPAALLSRAGTARVLVENGDEMAISDGYDRYPKSNAVDFVVSANSCVASVGK